jgi:ribosomal protein L35
MNKLKTKKALLKRFKITGRGKMLHRPIHQDHFNAKDSGQQTQAKRKKKSLSSAGQRILKNIPF